jgi:hypothetical protein
MNSKQVILLIALLGCLAPYLILCTYIFPSGDDYSYAWVGAKSNNFFNTLIGEWKTWNGRYISNVLVLINPISQGNFGLYQVVPLILTVLFVAVHSIIISKFLKGTIPQGTLVSLGVLVIYLNVLPDLGEGIYWYTAAVTYFAPLLILPIHLYFLNQQIKSPSTSVYVILIVLQFLLTGFNEVLMIIMTLLHLGAAIQQKRTSKMFWLLLGTQLLFSSLMYFAPGNEVRGSYFPDNHDVIHTVLNGSANTLRFSASLLLTPALWIGMLLFLKAKFKTKSQSAPLWIWIVIFFLPQIIACAGPVWTTGIIGQHRTPNFALYCQIMVITVFIQQENGHFIVNILKRISAAISYPRLLIALVISLLLIGNGRTASKDLLSGDAHGFHQQNLERSEKLESLAELQDTLIFISEHKYKPASIFIYDVTDDSNDWKNGVYTTYYNLKPRNITIRCKP